MQELGRDPTPEEIADEVHLPVERVRAVLRMSQQPISLQVKVGDSDGDTEFGDFIEDKEASNPMEMTAMNLLRDKLRDVLDTLTEREREVLEQRFGLSDGAGRTLEEVGKQFPGNPRTHPTDRSEGPAQASPSNPNPETGRLLRHAVGPVSAWACLFRSSFATFCFDSGLMINVTPHCNGTFYSR